MNGKSIAILSEAERHRLVQSPLDGEGLKLMFEAGLIWLTTNQQYVNSLNVFPVPDGDTGTNMVLTMQAPSQKRRPNPRIMWARWRTRLPRAL